MVKTLISISAALVVSLSLLPGNSYGQRTCGDGMRMERISREDPATAAMLRANHKLMVEAAMNAPYSTAKATAQSAIPVVFHVILTQAQYDQIGGDDGVRARANSQIAGINSDFNRANADSTLIPAPFKSVYGNAGIRFGIAKATNGITISGGIEVKILSGTPPIYDVNNDCYAAKVASTGLAAWDVNKYLNIWICNITNGSGGGTILGVTTPPGNVGTTYLGHTFTANEKGVSLNYGAFGVRESSGQYFIPNIDKGRTLTHELGHYFELWHTWGDDGGACPPPGSGADDNIADTPPQADATYCNKGATGNNCPSFPLTDACSGGNGIMFMNYMDYVDDRAMQMFTNNQVTVMRSKVAVITGESYSLTQNPDLLGVDNLTGAFAAGISVYPNPTNGAIRISVEHPEGLVGIDVVNLLGQHAGRIDAVKGKTLYDLNLPMTTARGLYIVQIRYDAGTVTKKIVLQ